MVGTLLFVLRFAVAGPWVETFFGGAVAAVGGALLYGALPRLLRPRPSLASAFALGLGLATLANSRPFVGLVTSLPVAAVLLAHLVARTRRGGWAEARGPMCRVVLPVLGVLAATAQASTMPCPMPAVVAPTRPARTCPIVPYTR